MTRLENTPKNNLKLKKEENQRKEQMTTANIAIACESLMMLLERPTATHTNTLPI